MSEASPEPSPARIAIPASITLLGVLCGLLSLGWADERPYAACLAIIAASLCDMVDGRVARAARARSAFGAELDSLADVVSFGVAPAWLAWRWSLADPGAGLFDPWILPAFGFLACGAVRLARFNVGAHEGSAPADEFGGLPIPAGALLVTTVVMASHELDLPALRERAVMLPVVLAAGALMVSRLPLPSYKRFPDRRTQVTWYGLIAGGVATLLFSGPGGTILLGFLLFYVSIGVRRALARRASAT